MCAIRRSGDDHLFLRYRVVDDYTQEMLDRQLDYMAGLPVTFVTIGQFESIAKGLLVVYQGEPEEAYGTEAPAVQEGWATGEVKQLYIAKGSFCEE